MRGADGTSREEPGHIAIIGVPLHLGADRSGVELGPAALRSLNLQGRLASLGYTVTDRGDIPVRRMPPAAGTPAGLKYVAEIARVNAALSRKVAREMREGRFPLVLGGDHSIAIGTVKGVLRRVPKLGVLWFDAHADANTAETTPSGNVHGMPLAVLLGYGHPSLTSIGGARAKLDPRHVAIVGARSIDPGERELLRSAGVNVFTMHEVDRYGMRAVMEDALARVTAGTDGVHLSLDLDVMDPAEAPGVGTPVSGGLSYRESHLAMEMLYESGALVSAEAVEVNPALDAGGKTARTAAGLLASALGQRIL